MNCTTKLLNKSHLFEKTSGFLHMLSGILKKDMKRSKEKQATRQVWIGRSILAVLIAAIVAVLVYAYVTKDSSLEQPAKKDSSSKTDSDKKTKQQEVAALVKDSYEAYFKTAYTQKSPDADAALDKFKKHMTAEGADALRSAKKGLDPVLCSKGQPKELTYTPPQISDNVAILAIVTTMKNSATTALVAVDISEGKIASISCSG